MDSNEAELKTVAILELQSPLIMATLEQWQGVADRLSTRLCHPVILLRRLDFEERAETLESLVKVYRDRGFLRVVVIPIGLEPYDFLGLKTAIAWSHQEPIQTAIHVARDWNMTEWSNLLVTSICDNVTATNQANALNNPSKPPQKKALLLVSDGGATTRESRTTGVELACLSHEMLQQDSGLAIRYAFMQAVLPSMAQVFHQMDCDQINQVVLLGWRLNQEKVSELFRSIGQLHALEMPVLEPSNAWFWDRRSNQMPRPLRLLDHPIAIHMLFEKYLDTLASRPIGRYFAEATSESDQDRSLFRFDLMTLDQRIDSHLPSEYQGRTDTVRSQSMGSRALIFNADGLVPWDEIWTSFCDLAMAGGPPHRGKLLEAISREQVLQDREAYQGVANEIRRGIELVTQLKTMESESLGWVGILCDDEAMAVWLMRAIIVENVMVRREKEILFVPAGPGFTIKREIKNVITSVAKTVHYWRAHLKTRS
jgi:hypothetical protein